MGKFFPDIRLVLFIILSLFGLQTACLLYGAELPGVVFVPGENRPQPNQEATQEAFIIKVNVPLVMTDVVVTGTLVPELRQEDFTVYDNGVAQTVIHFSRGQAPLAVALLIDGSSSIGPYLTMLKIAALSALRRLRSEDQVALFSFDSIAVKLSDLTSDRIAIVKEINKIRSGGYTNLYGSIYEVARYLAENAPNSRRAVILVSDNCSYDDKLDADSARVEMLKASATLYGIKTSGDSCGELGKQVQWIASETGGEILDANSTISLKTALEKAMSNLRLQYTLGFTPSNAGASGSFHKLTVNIMAEDRYPGCRVLARSGYYSGISAPFPSQKSDSVTPRNSGRLVDQELVQLIMLTAGTMDIDMTDVPFTVKASEQTDSKRQPQFIKLDIRIDFTGIKLAEEQDRRVCKLTIAVLYGDAEGNILGSDWGTVQGLLNKHSNSQTMKEGILVSTTIPIKVKQQTIKVVVYDETNDRLGSKVVRLDKKANRN